MSADSPSSDDRPAGGDHAGGGGSSPPPGPDDLRAERGVRVPASAMDFSFMRSSGPGGQNVNKLETKARLRVPIASIVGLDDGQRGRLRRFAGHRLVGEDELMIDCDEHRSQGANRRTCIDRLRALLDEASRRPRTRRPTRPGRRAKERRLKSKREASERKARRRWRPE